MSVLREWHGEPEVRAIDDKIKVDCIDISVSICMSRGVEYEVHCAFRDIDKHYMLLRKLAKISLKKHISGRFELTSHTSDGNIVKHSISAW